MNVTALWFWDYSPTLVEQLLGIARRNYMPVFVSWQIKSSPIYRWLDEEKK